MTLTRRDILAMPDGPMRRSLIAQMEAENGGSAKGRILRRRTPVLGKKRIRNEQPL